MKEIKKILVAVDLSGNSDKLLQSAIYFAGICNAKLLIVFVLEHFEEDSDFDSPYILLPEIEEEELQRMPIAELKSLVRQRAEEEMESLVKQNLSPAIVYETKMLEGEAAEEITEYARREAVDLILMGTHGYKGIDEFILGSQAHEVIKTSPCLVITDNYRISS